MNWRVLNLASIYITLDYENLNWMLNITKNHANNIRILIEEPFWQNVLNDHFILCKSNANFDLSHWDNGLKFQRRCETKMKITIEKEREEKKKEFLYWNHTCESLMRSLTGLWHAVSISILGWKLRAESHLFFHPFAVFFSFLIYFFFLHFNIKYIYLIKIAVALWQECNSVLISIHLVILAFLKLESLLITIIIIRLTKSQNGNEATEKKKKEIKPRRCKRLNSVSEWKKQ